MKVAATIKYVRDFTCAKCGKVASGQTETVVIACEGFEELAERAAAHASKATPRFPVTWARYYPNTYRCDQCVK